MTAPVAIVGGYFTSNMGGAGMTEAVVAHARSRDLRAAVLTLYPTGDRPHAPADVDLLAWRPQDILLSAPLALLAWVARLLRLSTRPFLRTAGLRALSAADVVVDVSGISFVDGRGLPIVIYNTLLSGVPLLLGTPVVKVAQAMGPFERPLNRALARLVLPRTATVIARGDQTAEHLATIGLDEAPEAADIAFTMPVGAEAAAKANHAINDLVGDDQFVGLIPSAVVKGYCDSRGIDYVGELAALAKRIRDELGKPVVVIPHALHPSAREGRMHDATVCQDVVAASGGTALLLEPWLGPDGLRAAIGRGHVLVTSRFHGMVSGLATHTPTLVIGWSHKYAEVLRQFGLDGWAIDYTDLRSDTMFSRLAALIDQEAEIRTQIADRLPGVQADARRNLEAIDAILDTAQTNRTRTA